MTTNDFEKPSNTPHPFRILALDGGGIRGAFTAAVLAEIENRLGSPIGDFFDLVAGTSTGGIIATGIAAGLPASRIVDFYRQEGPVVFSPRPKIRAGNWRWRLVAPIARFFTKKVVGISLDDLLQTKYDNEPLRTALTEVFGSKLIGDLIKCRMVVPAVDISVGRTKVFKTPHLPNLTRDRHYSLVDVLLGTTAAPTYFPHATLRADAVIVDGGLWANNPGLVAYTEAMKIRECCTRPCDPQFAPEDIYVLSIGTGEPRYSLSPPGSRAGLGWWGPKVFDVSSISQSQGVHFQLKYLLNDRYRRLNFELPDSTWTLDSIERIAPLIHQGQTLAHDNLADLMSTFFEERAPGFVPFEDLRRRMPVEELASC